MDSASLDRAGKTMTDFKNLGFEYMGHPLDSQDFILFDYLANFEKEEVFNNLEVIATE